VEDQRRRRNAFTIAWPQGIQDVHYDNKVFGKLQGRQEACVVSPELHASSINLNKISNRHRLCKCKPTSQADSKTRILETVDELADILEECSAEMWPA
jgi:hypothetical protein